MTAEMTSGILYLLVGAAIIYLFQQRRSQLASLTPDKVPELDEEGLAELRLLMKTAYERMLYMGVLFLPLAISTMRGSSNVSRLFFLLLIGLLFLSNIPPRNKIIRLLERYNLTVPDLQDRGIKV